MAAQRRGEREGLHGDRTDRDLALAALELIGRGSAHRYRPGADAAHHHALEHGLTADRRIAPPRSHALALRRCGALPAAGDAALEALDATACVDQLLAARVERVAVRADLDAQLGLGGASLELVPARAAHDRGHVLRMDLGLHRTMKC